MDTHSINSALTPFLIPESYRNDRRLKKCYHFLPLGLLKTLGRLPALRAYVDRDTLTLDLAMATARRDAHSIIALHQGEPVLFTLFQGELPIPEVPPYLLKIWGMTAERVRANLNSVLPVLDQAKLCARAYVGWLLTDTVFLAERDQLLKKWSKYIDEFGLPGAITIDNAATRNHFEAIPKRFADASQFIADWRDCYRRWELDGMAGSMLPRPLMNHLVALPHGLSENRNRHADITLTSIACLPDAETFRQLAENAARAHHKDHEHLAEWHKIVSNSNRQRAAQVARYARMAELTHYWRVLVDHYGRPSHGMFEPLIGALSDHFGVPEPTLQIYLRKIRKMDRDEKVN